MEELSDSQRAHWERQLEYARKAVEVAEKMLGIVATKEEVETDEVHQRDQTNGETTSR